MSVKEASKFRTFLVWTLLIIVLAVPIIAAAFSPQLQWRDPIYIVAGFAGIIAMCLMLVQPLLIGGYLPNLSSRSTRRTHRWIGSLLVAGVIIHVAALYLTSPPDVIDALLFASPTPFSIWGVIAMWAVFATALLAGLRKRLRLKPKTWRIGHTGLAVVIVIGSVVHAMLIEGTMEVMSKTVLCALVLISALRVIVKHLRLMSKMPK